MSGTLFSKYACLSFDELLRIEYTKRSLFQISLLMNKTRVCTEIIACPARIRRKTVRTLPIPRLPSINTNAFTKTKTTQGKEMYFNSPCRICSFLCCCRLLTCAAILPRYQQSHPKPGPLNTIRSNRCLRCRVDKQDGRSERKQQLYPREQNDARLGKALVVVPWLGWPQCVDVLNVGVRIQPTDGACAFANTERGCGRF